MFYHPLLLHSQHKMQLSMPWLAATLGVKKINKSRIIYCDTSKLCDFILQFLQSESRDPLKRLSLRLSTMLVHGTVLIWRQQVIFLSEDIDQYIKRQESHSKRLAELLAERSPIIEKKKRKKRKSIVQTPESLVLLKERDQPVDDLLEPIRLPELLQESAIVQARIDEITLREDAPRVQEALRDDFGEPEIFRPEPTMAEIVEPPHPQIIRIQADVHVSAEPPIELARPIPSIPVEEQILPEEIPEISVLPEALDEVEKLVEKPSENGKGIDEISVEVQKEKPKRPSKKKTIEEQPVEKEKEVGKETVADQEQEEIVEVFRDIPSKIGKKKEKMILQKPSKRFRPITRKLKTFDDEEDYTEIREQKIPAFVPMEKFWPSWESATEDRAVDDILREGRRTDTLGSTSTLEPVRGTPSIGSVAQSTPQEVVASIGQRFVSTSTKRALPGDETITEVLPPAANGIHLFTPTKKRKVVSVGEAEPLPETVQEMEKLAEPIEEQIGVEPSVQVQLQEPELEIVAEQPQPIQEVSLREEPMLPSSNEDDYLGIIWAYRIMRVVYTNVQITSVNICKQLQERLTRLHMARIFASLLALEKNGYVLMHSAENSIELEVVEKGPKQFDFK